MQKRLSILFVLGILALTGCGTGGSASEEATEAASGITPYPEPTAGATLVLELASSPEHIMRAWVGSAASRLYVEFLDDGTAHSTGNPDELADNPFWIWDYWFEGTELHLQQTYVAVDHPAWTCGDTIGVYHVEMHDTGTIRFVALDDACDARRNPLMGANIYVYFSPLP